MARTSDRFVAVDQDNHLSLGKDQNDHLSVVMEEKAEIKVGLYARISVDRNDKNESIDSQIAIMEAFIKKYPQMQIIQNYVDCGKSGSDFNRPEFQRMMVDAKSKKINCIIVKDLSRLGRNQLEVSNLIYTLFPFLKVRFISINDYYDTDEVENNNKGMEVAIKNLVNEMYAKDISKRIALSRNQSMKKGSFVGSYAPYGYQLEMVEGIRKMIIDVGAAVIVRDIFQWTVQGICLRDIAIMLNDKRVTIPGQYQKTKHVYIEAGEEEKKWHIGTLSNILHNQAYIGNVVQNKSTKKLYANKPEKQNLEAEFIVLEDFHDAIVSKEIFAKVQHLNQEKITASKFSSNRGSKVKIQENKYKGILFCGVCGKSIPQVSELVEKVNDKTGKTSLIRKYIYYCTGRAGSNEPHVGGIRIVETLLDEIVMKALQDQVETFIKDKKTILQVIEKAAKQRRKGYDRKLGKHRSKIGELDYQESELYGEYVMKNISYEEYENGNREMAVIRKRLKDEIALLEVEIRGIDADEVMLRRWTKVFLKCHKAQKVTKGLLEEMVERIELGEGLGLHLRKELHTRKELHPDQELDAEKELNFGKELNSRIELRPGKELKIKFKFQQDLEGMLVPGKRAI